jgi:hypothetical protein
MLKKVQFKVKDNARGPRLRCERCGHLGANARPNWNEMHKQKPITRASSASEFLAVKSESILF